MHTTHRSILRFWSPLAMTWLLMAAEGPIVAAIIARMPEPKINLASFGIAFAFALIFEAPVIMLMSATVALVKNPSSYLKMLNFTRVLNWVVLAINLLVLFTPTFQHVINLLDVPKQVETLTYNALLLLLPWPVAIGYRRFYQGILIKYKQTRKVAWGTFIRLVCMFSTCYSAYYLNNTPGVCAGAMALSAGVLSECIFVFFASRPIVNALMSYPKQEQEPDYVLSYPFILRFCYPLALTSFIGLAVQPLVTFFVGMCRSPLESLAVLPVINAFIFIFKCIGLSYQEVVIALIGDEFEGYTALRSFSYSLAGIFSFILILTVFTPLADLWFEVFFGLSPELYDFARIPLRIMSFVPALTIILCWQRAMAINTRNNILITYAVGIECGIIVLGMSVGAYFNWYTGAVIACTSLSLGRLAGCLFLANKKAQISHDYKSSAIQGT